MCHIVYAIHILYMKEIHLYLHGSDRRCLEWDWILERSVLMLEASIPRLFSTIEHHANSPQHENSLAAWNEQPPVRSTLILAKGSRCKSRWATT